MSSSKDRTPISIRIRLKYPDIDTFIEKYSANISKGGMFIQSRSPQIVGTPLRFEVLLQEGTPLLKGEGSVIWVKEYDAAHPTQVHGMGVRFSQLDQDSQALIDRVIAFKNLSNPPAMQRSGTQEVRHLLQVVASAEIEDPEEVLAEALSRQSGRAPEPQPAPSHQAATANEKPTPLELETITSKLLQSEGHDGGLTMVLATAEENLGELLIQSALSEDHVAKVFSRLVVSPVQLANDEQELQTLLAPVQVPTISFPQLMKELRHQHGGLPLTATSSRVDHQPSENVQVPAAQLAPLASKAISLAKTIRPSTIFRADPEEEKEKPAEVVPVAQIEAADAEATRFEPVGPEMFHEFAAPDTRSVDRQPAVAHYEQSHSSPFDLSEDPSASTDFETASFAPEPTTAVSDLIAFERELPEDELEIEPAPPPAEDEEVLSRQVWHDLRQEAAEDLRQGGSNDTVQQSLETLDRTGLDEQDHSSDPFENSSAEEEPLFKGLPELEEAPYQATKPAEGNVHHRVADATAITGQPVFDSEDRLSAFEHQDLNGDDLLSDPDFHHEVFEALAHLEDPMVPEEVNHQGSADPGKGSPTQDIVPSLEDLATQTQSLFTNDQPPADQAREKAESIEIKPRKSGLFDIIFRKK
jgi:uncharacterized protein (TIGR02266 family)